jgi:hypothetical protein
MGVAAGGVGLPDLHQRVGYRAAGTVQDAAAEVDPLAQRGAVVLAREVVVELLQPPLAEQRPRDLGERMGKCNQPVLRRAQLGGAVIGPVERRVDLDVVAPVAPHQDAALALSPVGVRHKSQIYY